MATRKLTKQEIETLFKPLFEKVKEDLNISSNSSADLLWALRRKLAKELVYLERSKPAVRRALKTKKRKTQAHMCALGEHRLPGTGAVLDRIETMNGYTEENTRLLCPTCDAKVQKERGYK